MTPGTSTVPDPNTFKVLAAGTVGDSIGEDKSHVYYGSDMTSVDPNSIQLIPGNNGDLSFVKDKNAVYELGANGDPAVGGTCQGMCPLINSDPALFTMLSPYDYGYSKDKNNVYSYGGYDSQLFVISGADPASFELVSPLPTACNLNTSAGDATDPAPGCYDAKDKYHEYFQGSVVQ